MKAKTKRRKEKEEVKKFLSECEKFRQERLSGSTISISFQKEGTKADSITVNCNGSIRFLILPFKAFIRVSKNGKEIPVNQLSSDINVTWK